MDKVSWSPGICAKHAHLLEVGRTEISGDHFNIFISLHRTNYMAYTKTNSRTNKHHQVILLN